MTRVYHDAFDGTVAPVGGLVKGNTIDLRASDVQSRELPAYGSRMALLATIGSSAFFGAYRVRAGLSSPVRGPGEQVVAIALVGDRQPYPA